MSDTFEIANGPVRIRVTGLRNTIRDLERAGADTQDMKELIHGLGMIIVKAANPPQITGKLRDTIRAGKGKTKAVVRAGGARAPYAGVIHYGWPARNISPAPFLLNALREERSDVLKALEDGLADIMKKRNLI